MRKKKLKRRSKRIGENNRKTIGLGWDTQKTARRGVTEPYIEEKPVRNSFWEWFLNMFRGKK